VPYGGFPQDPEVPGIRKKLYEQVMKDGLKPKLDENNRPQFFFRQNNVKACYTEGGLGMSVYEWRPKFVESNEVGIELELAL
jgi:Ni,Fe-hydrogenase I small subunit